MPMAPPTATWLLAAAACVPRYSHLPALGPEALRTPAPLHHTAVDGVDIAWIDTGPPPSDAGQPPLVLIHGLSSHMGYWEYQVPVLARTHRVLAVDLPGYGASGRPDAPYTPPWYADLLATWMETVGLTRAILVGHSMGGQISLTLALRHPEKVDRLVLAAPAGLETFAPGPARWMKDYWHEGRALEAREDELRATFSTLVFNRMDEGAEALLAERVRLGRHPAFRGTSVAVARSVAGMLDHPVYARLGEIAVPTLIVYGTDDRMIPNPAFTGGSTRAIAQRGQRAIRGSELVMLDGAGHTVMHDDPEGFNGAVLDFLRRSPAEVTP